VIEDRLAVAREELEAKKEFAHVIVNDRLEDAVQALQDLVATILGPTRGATK
jgi:guanylate kinase